MAPSIADSMVDKLLIRRTPGHFADRFSRVSVFEVSDEHNFFAAFVYMCRLNLDLDGAPTTYGFDNPAKGSLQKNLSPLENWHKGRKGVSVATSEKVGLANACGDPGDGSHGHKNFLAGTRNFYWAGIKAVSKTQSTALSLVIDDRAELEAGLESAASNGKPVLKAVGSGFFPVIQSDSSSPTAGYYISTTSVVSDGSLSIYDANRYLNSSVVPYAVWANNWNHLKIGGRKVQQGDVGLAIENRTGASMGFVYGDSGTQNKVGECSLKLNKAMGREGGLVTFIALPGSGSGKQLGKNPEATIPWKVLKRTLRLQTNAKELAARLAMGRDLPMPQNAPRMGSEQALLFENFMFALSRWTFPH